MNSLSLTTAGYLKLSANYSKLCFSTVYCRDFGWRKMRLLSRGLESANFRVHEYLFTQLFCNRYFIARVCAINEDSGKV